MKLNHDYVRDILLFIEKNLGYEEQFFGKILANECFANYDKDQLSYALELLIQENYINCAKPAYFVRGRLMTADIVGLTYKGHELLDNIRNDTVWNAVKEKAKTYGQFSIKTLASVAGTLTTSLMSDPNAIQNFLDGINNIPKTL